jgi:hypothetical protein
MNYLGKFYVLGPDDDYRILRLSESCIDKYYIIDSNKLIDEIKE